ncbi:MAG: Indole-3-glycerol phosphate synthase [Candidatus Marinimicrobia bacterium]|nr:Indole-3-glycerol phosphate synthase [Candidatus Neomarinimicrobiota bacterium]
MSVLQEILAIKSEEVAERKRKVPLNSLQERSDDIRDYHSALAGGGMSVIAEIKRKSPSQGQISADTNHVGIAKSYEQNRAVALSVLTDEKYFGGSLKFLQNIREAVDLPVLRKDFIISEYQIWESYHAGADAVLLILDALAASQFAEFYQLADELGLHVLVETHSSKSVEKLAEVLPKIVGVNARNLHTMEIEFDRMLAMRKDLPESMLAVAESGITAPDHLKQAMDAGYDAALIGTAFMSTENPGETLGNYLAEVRQEVSL